MAISEQQLSAILQNAKKLCNPAGDKKISANTSHGANSLNNPDPAQYDAETLSWENSLYDNNTSSSYNTPNVTENYDETLINESKLPDEIKRSFLNKKIDKTALASLNPRVANAINSSLSKQKASTPKVSSPTKINEQSVRPMNNGGVDYSIIKAIVNECLNNYFEKHSLNESVGGNPLKTIYLKEGKIRLIDNKGNIFYAQLEKKGNINDKK